MVYLKIKENTTQAKIMIELLKTMSYAEIIKKEDIPNAKTIKAMEEAEKGGLKRYKTVKALMKDLKS